MTLESRLWDRLCQLTNDGATPLVKDQFCQMVREVLDDAWRRNNPPTLAADAAQDGLLWPERFAAKQLQDLKVQMGDAKMRAVWVAHQKATSGLMAMSLPVGSQIEVSGYALRTQGAAALPSYGEWHNHGRLNSYSDATTFTRIK